MSGTAAAKRSVSLSVAGVDGGTGRASVAASSSAARCWQAARMRASSSALIINSPQERSAPCLNVSDENTDATFDLKKFGPDIGENNEDPLNSCARRIVNQLCFANLCSTNKHARSTNSSAASCGC